MTEIKDSMEIKGNIDVFIRNRSGEVVDHLEYKNTILRTGRAAVAKALVGQDLENFYISRMVFGTHGAVGGVPKYVNEGRNGLFGVTALSKPVISAVDPNNSTTANFTSVIGYEEANSLSLNEMALQMVSGDLYSMRTFPDLNKTADIQITFVWHISLV